jgi:hypothetical protein
MGVAPSDEASTTSTPIDLGKASLEGCGSHSAASFAAWAVGCGSNHCCQAIDLDYEYPGPPSVERGPQLEQLLERLFRLQDLAGDGLLDESELVKLNEKVAMLHRGVNADSGDVKAKYQKLFRKNLDPDGKPVGYGVFRRYMVGVLDELDPDENAQEMIIEQFIAETRLARRAFYQTAMKSEGDTPFRPKLSDADEWSVTDTPTPLSKHDTPEVKSSSDTKCSSPRWTPNKGGSNVDKFSLVVTPPRVHHPGGQQCIVKNRSFDEPDPISSPAILKYSVPYSSVL